MNYEKLDDVSSNVKTKEKNPSFVGLTSKEDYKMSFIDVICGWFHHKILRGLCIPDMSEKDPQVSSYEGDSCISAVRMTKKDEFSNEPVVFTYNPPKNIEQKILEEEWAKKEKELQETQETEETQKKQKKQKRFRLSCIQGEYESLSNEGSDDEEEQFNKNCRKNSKGEVNRAFEGDEDSPITEVVNERNNQEKETSTKQLDDSSLLTKRADRQFTHTTQEVNANKEYETKVNSYAQIFGSYEEEPLTVPIQPGGIEETIKSNASYIATSHTQTVPNQSGIQKEEEPSVVKNLIDFDTTMPSRQLSEIENIQDEFVQNNYNQDIDTNTLMSEICDPREFLNFSRFEMDIDGLNYSDENSKLNELSQKVYVPIVLLIVLFFILKLYKCFRK